MTAILIGICVLVFAVILAAAVCILGVGLGAIIEGVKENPLTIYIHLLLLAAAVWLFNNGEFTVGIMMTAAWMGGSFVTCRHLLPGAKDIRKIR